MGSRTYAGIGSRSTPAHVLAIMTRLAAALDRDGYTLRSGAAEGADTAFGHGAEHAEIYLPWPTFARVQATYGVRVFTRPQRAAYECAAEYHPAWERLGTGATALHARNSHQVLGPNLNDPVRFVVCWTVGARGGGGTGQAIRLAKGHGVPVFDLANDAVMSRMLDYIEKSELTRAHQQPLT